VSSPSTEARDAFVLDRGARLFEAGRVIVGGEPARVMRLSAAGAAALGDLLDPSRSGTAARPAAAEAGGSAEAALVARLESAGIVHRLPPAVPRRALDDVTVVIPVLDPPPSLGGLLAALHASDRPVAAVVLVDDGSDDGGAATVALGAEHGAQVVLRSSCGGPAAARNAAPVGTSLVAFLDADAVLASSVPGESLAWLERLAWHLDRDRELALVAPRIRSAEHAGGVARYETYASALDLGPDPGLVGPRRRLTYVPAAAFLVRTEVFSALGGFDEALRYGEDVEFVLRLAEGGWRVRYEPSAEVGHLPRATWSGFVRQRYSYGTAAAAIERRHPGSVAPFVAAPPAALAVTVGAAALTGWRLRRALPATAAAGGAIGAVTTVRLARKLEASGCARPVGLASRLVIRSFGGATAGLLSATRRAWWPVAAPLLLVRRCRRRVLAAGFVALLAGHGRAAWRSEGPLRHLVAGVADDLAYSCGVFAGCARERSLAALRPRLVRAADRSQQPAGRSQQTAGGRSQQTAGGRSQ
jgi:mycofactocin system glycosyltransferase